MTYQIKKEELQQTTLHKHQKIMSSLQSVLHSLVTIKTLILEESSHCKKKPSMP